MDYSSSVERLQRKRNKLDEAVEGNKQPHELQTIADGANTRGQTEEALEQLKLDGKPDV